jgi:hypothetical protein
MTPKRKEELTPLDKIKSLPPLQRRIVVATVLGPSRGRRKQVLDPIRERR